MGLGGEDFDHSLGGELARLEAGEAELGEGLDAELGLVVLLDDVEEVLDGVLPFGHLAAEALGDGGNPIEGAKSPDDGGEH